jgi:hypothetical protein
LLLSTILILAPPAEKVSAAGDKPQALSFVEEFGLTRGIREEFFRYEQPSQSAPPDLLVRSVLASRGLFRAWSQEDMRRDLLVQLLEEKGARQLLEVHWSSGEVWFNKERFEELLGWLALFDLVVVASELTDTEVAKLAVAHAAAVCDLVAQAEESGYRVDNLLSLLPQPKVKPRARRKKTDETH